MKKTLLLALLLLSSTIVDAQETQHEVDVRNYPDFCTAISRIPSVQTSLLIRTNIRVLNSCEVPPNITLHFVPPGMLTTSPGSPLRSEDRSKLLLRRFSVGRGASALEQSINMPIQEILSLIASIRNGGGRQVSPQATSTRIAPPHFKPRSIPINPCLFPKASSTLTVALP